METLEIDILGRSSLYILSLLLLVITSCGELSEYDSLQVKEALADSLLNTTESWNMNMVLVDEGTTLLKLRGSRSVTIKESTRNETRISGPVFIEIFKDTGELKSTVVCDSAFYLPDDATFEMFGNVLVTTEDGKKLSSSYLKWERKKDMVSTPEFVTFVSPPDSIAANGFIGNTELTSYILNEGGGTTVID